MRGRLWVIAIFVVLALFMAWNGTPRTTAQRIANGKIASGDSESRKKEIAQRFANRFLPEANSIEAKSSNETDSSDRDVDNLWQTGRSVRGNAGKAKDDDDP